MTCGIYKITNNINGKIYIGQSIDIERRFKQHLKKSNRDNTQIINALKKYGKDNFSFEIIKHCKREDLDLFERFWIKIYDTTNRNIGYNTTIGGNGITFTDEIRKKISDGLKGKKRKFVNKSDEHKQNIKKSNTPDKQKTSIKFIYEGVCYNSIRECSRITGINRRTIGRYIKRCQN